MVGIAILVACSGSIHGFEAPIFTAAVFSGWRAGRDADGTIPATTSGGSSAALADLGEIVRALDIAAIVLDAQRRILVFNRHAADLFPAISTGDPMALANAQPRAHAIN